MTAEVCGSSSKPRNAAPPLKSTRTRFSSSDECVAAMESTSVRSSSLLPEPVAPINRPCGPMPSSAASLMSSSMGVPVDVMPIGTRSRFRAPVRVCRYGTGSNDRRSPSPSRVGSS